MTDLSSEARAFFGCFPLKEQHSMLHTRHCGASVKAGLGCELLATLLSRISSRADAEARERERERCAKAVCCLCGVGLVAVGGWHLGVAQVVGPSEKKQECPAARIRALRHPAPADGGKGRGV